MSVIQNFKNRQLQKAQKEQNSVKEKLAQQLSNQDVEATALMLLATLLNVAEEHAIDVATKYVESEINYFAVDHAEGKDKTVTANVEKDDAGNVTSITEITSIDTDVDELEAVKDELVADIENSADALQSAASNVESSAEKASDVADNLAYTADDISTATDELKEAAAEIKKPSAVQKSSSLKKTNEQKNSSNK